MELMAAVEALKFLPSDILSKITITTDSKYVKDGINEWLPNWKKVQTYKHDLTL
jgi:ribonuclease HI